MKKALFVICALFQLIAIPSALAVGSSGFEIGSNSTSSLSKSNAVVADPQDASVIAFNPAGLARLHGVQIVSGTSFIAGSVDYESRNGFNEEASETIIPVPYSYVSLETPVENLYLGVGANAMFGLMSKYSSQGAFKYTGYHNEMKTKGYHASTAYKVSEKWSVGIGYTYLEASIKQVGKYNLSVLAGAPGLGDGDFELDVAGHGHGWNAGVLYTPGEKHSLGAFYRSQIRTQFDGQLASDNMGALAAVFGGTNTQTSATSDIKYPHNLTFGYQYAFNTKLRAEIDLGWTGWSSFDHQLITFGSSNAVLAGFSETNRDFKDVISVNTGLTYALINNLNLSAGYYFYDMSSDKDNFSPDIPDGNRHGVSLGLQHTNNNLTIEFMYLFTFTEDTAISNNVGNGNGADIDGTYSTATHIMSVGLTYRI